MDRFLRGTQGRLLAHLAETPGQELHTRELIRTVGRSERAVQVALERLEAQGLVESRRLGNLRLWRIVKTHPLYEPLRQSFASTLGVASELRKGLQKQPGIELAFLFGSYARGDDDAASDIDLFILGQPDWDRVAKILPELERKLRREINAVIWTDLQLARQARSRSPFFGSLLGGAKVWIIGNEADLERRTSTLGARERRPLAARRRNGGRQPKAQARRSK